MRERIKVSCSVCGEKHEAAIFKKSEEFGYVKTKRGTELFFCPKCRKEFEEGKVNFDDLHG